MKTRIVLPILFSALLAAVSAAPPTRERPQRGPHPSLAKVEDVPGLPRVLLIGDSISMGYTVPVRELLKGKANVHRIPANGGPTTNGIKSLQQWLGDSSPTRQLPDSQPPPRWDVIHFNWGLHDVKYVLDDPSKRADPKAPGAHRQVSIEDYEKNLRELVARLKATGAKLIWCNTTPVPEASDGRIAGEEVQYNEVAARVMKENGIPTNDLHAHALAKLKDVQLPANVHYSDAGYQYLAEKVAAVLADALPRK